MPLKQINIKMVSCFPNLNIVFRKYLWIFGTPCEGERSVSVLKRVKKVDTPGIIIRNKYRWNNR